MKTRQVFLGVFLALVAFAALVVVVFFAYSRHKLNELDSDRKAYNLASEALGEEVRFTAADLYRQAHGAKLGNWFDKRIDVTGTVVGTPAEEPDGTTLVTLDAGEGKKVQLHFNGTLPSGVKTGEAVHVRGVLRVGVDGFGQFRFWLTDCRLLSYQ